MKENPIIKLAKEQYNDFNIEMNKIRGEKQYETTIKDKVLQKTHRITIDAATKNIAIEKLKPYLDKLRPQKTSWLARKTMLENKYNIQELSLNDTGRYNFIFFHKGIHWTVKIESTGRTVLRYEKFPYGDIKTKNQNLSYEERSRTNSILVYSFKADLERQIIEAINRIKKYDLSMNKIGTFGINPETVSSSIDRKSISIPYRKFKITVDYLYNKTEKEYTASIYVYSPKGHLMTTDNISERYVEPARIRRLTDQAANKGKDWIAKQIIFNLKTSKTIDANMNAVKSEHSWKPSYDSSYIRSKAKNREWSNSAEKARRGY